MAESDIEEKVSFFKAQAEAMKSLRKAFQLDAERGKLLGDRKEDDPTPRKNVKEWFRGNWINVIIWVIAAGIVWSVLTPKKQPKRSHHKYDENGRLVY